MRMENPDNEMVSHTMYLLNLVSRNDRVEWMQLKFGCSIIISTLQQRFGDVMVYYNVVK